MQVMRISLIEICFVSAMYVVYALIGKFSFRVLIGGICGTLISVANFLFLTFTVIRAVQKAEQNETSVSARLSILFSSTIRLIFIAAVYVVIIKLNFCDPIAALLPLLFLQISIRFVDSFSKGGEAGK